MSQELESYIYILDEKKGPTYNIISFEPTLRGARKTMAKLVKNEKYTLETNDSKVYTTKSDNSMTLFLKNNDTLIQEKTISIKRVSNHGRRRTRPTAEGGSEKIL